MGRPILLVDDDPDMVSLVTHFLTHEGLEVLAATTGAEAERVLAETQLGLVVLDLGLPDISGAELLEQITQSRPNLPVVIVTVQDALEDVVNCMQLGAQDYIHKPFDRSRLVTSVKNALEQGKLRSQVATLAGELRRADGLRAILGESPSIRAAVDLLRRAASGEVTVLLQGESGTGKEVAARALHAEGPRRAGPLVVINCGAIPSGLAESELFGHAKGAFTGASSARLGPFEQAEGGTVFLDEIGELPLDLQVKLLRVLQERVIQRVGEGRERPVDVRLVAASHRDLRSDVEQGRFREDLFYRLSVFPVCLPPLRERGEDVLLLARRFLARSSKRHGSSVSGLTPEAAAALLAYTWPGNIRELENVIERAVILEDRAAISLGSLSDEVVCAVEEPAALALASGVGPVAAAAATISTPEAILPLETVERELIQRALQATGWNMKEAARRLEIGRATIYRKVERFGLQRSPST